tara:strand:- start:718 stop:1836 length:1119 start_codon:yes stop_codon:yes gene_type:complete
MSISLRSAILGSGDSHIYYDLSIQNNDITGSSAPTPLIFEEVRSNPYLTKPDDYLMSVVRFNVETPTLPLWIPVIETGQANRNKTVYTITLSYLGFEFQQNLLFNPSDLSQPLPTPPLITQDLSTTYYYGMSYTKIMTMVNNAFSSAVVGLNALVGLPTVVPPFMEFDPYSYQCILNAPQIAYADSAVNPIGIFFNTPMWNLFSSFNSVYLGYSNIINGKNYQLSTTTNNNITTIGGVAYLQFYQEYPTIPLWTPIQSIVFVSSLLPISPALVGVPKVYTNGILSVSANNANIASIITDLEVPLDKGFEYKSSINYTPQSEYRLIDLNGNNPVSAIQIQVYWKDKLNNLRPLYIQGNANIKIMFRKKQFNNL